MFETIFSAASTLAMVGWLCLLVRHRSRWANWWLAGVAIPAVLSLTYTVLLATQWRPGQGGFGSLAEVTVLFQSPGVLLAGWIHYLAFDLAIGAWEARRASERGLPWCMLAPCLLLTFLFGPVGWLLFMAVNRARGEGAPSLHVRDSPVSCAASRPI